MSPRTDDDAYASVVSSKLLLTAEQVAEQLQVDPHTVRRYALRGDLEYVRLGHSTLRFRQEWIDEMIERKQLRGKTKR